MSSAVFDSSMDAGSLNDPLMAYTYSSASLADENLLVGDDVRMHYLAIPVDALSTRTVTIQVFYDATGQKSGEKAKFMEEDETMNEKKLLKLVVDGGKKQQQFDPFIINQNTDNESFDTPLNAEHDPMLLDSQLHGNYMLTEAVVDDSDCFMSNGKDIIGDEKNDSLFFDDGLVDPNNEVVSDYTHPVSTDTYQNESAFVVEENVQQAPAQVQVEEFRVIKRFAPVSETTPFMRREEFGTRQQEVQTQNTQLQTPPPLKMYRCTHEHCGKLFPSQRGLKYHSVGHSPAIYSCSKCKKSFASMLKLKRHSMIHDGVRPFPCDYENCEKSFTTKSNLNVHRRTHTGEKPYVCSVCSRAFSHQSHAKAHLKIHLKKLHQQQQAHNLSQQDINTATIHEQH